MADAHFRVFRGGRGEPAHYDEFDVPAEEGMVVLDALHWIQGHEAPDLAVRWNCKAAKCGSCSAEVDGRPSLTCATRVGPDKQLYYEKGGDPVTRDQGRYNWWGRDPAWKDVRGFRGKRDVEKPAGEWNRMEVICDGDTITNIVNCHVVNVGTRSSLTQGKILLQSEGAELFCRKIEVRPLFK